MKNTYGTALFPYVFGISFTGILALLIGTQNWMFAVFFGGCTVFVLVMLVNMYFRITVDDDGIEMSAYLGFVKDKVLYSEIADMRSKAISGTTTLYSTIDADIYEKIVTIVLKDGSEYVLTNDQIPDMKEMLADMRNRMGNYPQ